LVRTQLGRLVEKLFPFLEIVMINCPQNAYPSSIGEAKSQDPANMLKYVK
jgi:hypothetical protein